MFVTKLIMEQFRESRRRGFSISVFIRARRLIDLDQSSDIWCNDASIELDVSFVRRDGVFAFETLVTIYHHR